MTSESPAKSESMIEEVGQSTKPTPKHIFEGHKDSIWSIVFLHDNIHVVSASGDGTMRKWNCDTGLLVGEPWKGKGGAVYALALSPDGEMIACGRDDGSVQRWNTDGDMERVWTGHSGSVRSLSWSPSGSHIASGSDDKTILIRKTQSGALEVSPIKTNQSWVRSLAYSPLRDRIAAGGQNRTICIWDSKTGELVVGPIKTLGGIVTSLVWSLDGTKLYSASDRFARVFDSISGAELHQFKDDYILYSIALSLKGNVLACMGFGGTAHLWDTETHELGQQLGNNHARFYFGSFSRDGRYLAHGGDDKNITLWITNEIAPGLAKSVESASTTIEDAPPEEEEIRPDSLSLSHLDLDAKDPLARSGDHVEEGSVDPYKNCIRSSKTSLALASGSDPVSCTAASGPSSPTLDIARQKKNPAPPKDRHKRNVLRRRALSKSLRVSTTMDSTKPASVQEGEHVEERRKDVDFSTNSPPEARKKKMDKGNQRQHSLNDVQLSHHDYPSPPTEERGDQYDDFSQPLHPPPAPRLWDVLIPSRRHAPGNESTPLQRRPKRNFFAWHSGPRPVTIHAARPEKWYYTSQGKNRNAEKKNGKTNAETTQSSSAAAHSSSAAQPHPMPQSQQQPQAQVPLATQPAGAQHEEYDFGCWGSFWMALCVPHRPRRINVVNVPPPGLFILYP